MKAKRTLVLVADGGRARIFENLGPGKGLHQVENIDETSELAANRNLLDDRPGRSYESQGAMRHAHEQTDRHQELEHRFIEGLLERLDGLRAEDKFDRLIVVAPPKVLGDIRKIIPKELSKIVSAELARDLTRTPTDEIVEHLAEVAPF